MKLFGKKKAHFALLLLAIICLVACKKIAVKEEASTMQIKDLKVQNLESPIGIQSSNPVFSWKLESDQKGSSQTAYQIVAASSKSNLESGNYDKWNSGKVKSTKNYGVIYDGEKLNSMEGVYWAVIVWDEKGAKTAMSDASYFEMGLLKSKDWQASWITKGEEQILYPLLGKEEAKKEQGSVYKHSIDKTQTNELKINVYETGPAALGEYNDANLRGVIYRLQIMEVEIYCDGVKVDMPKNTKVVATNSFVYGSQWNASAMIDGSYFQGYTSNATSKNVYDNPISVSINFGSEVTFDEVRIYCRTDSNSTEQNVCPNYPKIYNIEVKNSDGYKKVVDNKEDKCPKIYVASNNTNAPILSTEFSLNTAKKIVKARAYVTGLGVFEAYVNGKVLGEGTYFNPGESDVRKTVYYCTYDITELMKDNNAFSIILGNGQYANYRIHKQFGRYYKVDDARNDSEVAGMFGDVKCLAQIVVTYEDGTQETIASDETWKYIESPITENSWYGGEDYDATLEIEGWNDVSPAISREQWGNAVVIDKADTPKGELVGVEFNPIRIQEKDTITSDKIKVTKIKEVNGMVTYLVDMGKNHAGIPEITIKGSTLGQVIKMYPAEIKDFTGYEGHINQESCTQSASKNGDLIYDTYITKGETEEVYHPRFCYHGYQYLEVVAPSNVQIDSSVFKSYILRTDNDKNGSFECSDEILNKINTIIETSIESNMYSTFTDCPQIEKLGWLETPGLMFYSMSHTYDISAWIPKIVRDMVDSQATSGRFAAIAPEYFRIGGLQEDLNWNGSVIFTSWQYYEAYGDASIFTEETYGAMRRYMNYLKLNVARNNLITSGQMGDWGEMTKYGTTPVVIVETTAYYRMAVCMEKISTLMGKTGEAKTYQKLAEDIKKAFHENKTCYNEEHLYGNGTQSGYGCVLFSGIVLEENREETVNRLVQAIEETGYHLTSGEVGLKQVFYALAENGRSDIVYKMVMNDSMPSYKYFIDKGLTALPEYWNYEDLWWGLARSRNHAMMGHVKEWFTRYLAGISLTEVGYDKIIIKPTIVENVSSVKGKVDTVHGVITSEYVIVDGKITMTIDLPVGVSANVYVPMLSEGGEVLLDGAKVKGQLTEDGKYFVINNVISSGKYVIEVK